MKSSEGHRVGARTADEVRPRGQVMRGSRATVKTVAFTQGEMGERLLEYVEQKSII